MGLPPPTPGSIWEPLQEHSELPEAGQGQNALPGANEAAEEEAKEPAGPYWEDIAPLGWGPLRGETPRFLNKYMA